VLSTIKYRWTVPCVDGVDEEPVEAVGGSRRRSMWRRSSARGLPAAAARSRAVDDGSKKASCKKRFTLYMVISAVGEDDIMMIGNMFLVFRACMGGPVEGVGVAAVPGLTSLSSFNFSVKLACRAEKLLGLVPLKTVFLSLSSISFCFIRFTTSMSCASAT